MQDTECKIAFNTKLRSEVEDWGYWPDRTDRHTTDWKIDCTLTFIEAITSKSAANLKKTETNRRETIFFPITTKREELFGLLTKEAAKRGIINIIIHKIHEPTPYEEIKFIDDANKKLQLNSK